jgi:cytidylate kinase
MIIAIDGTLASGKGSIARRIASWYGIPHMDTGRLYRATGIAAVKAGLEFEDEAGIARLAETLDLNDFNEADLRTAAAGQAASKVAAQAQVRAALLELQRAFANQPGGAILDGRDIGTIVCPEAEVKLWIDASPEERAKRRCLELEAAGNPISLTEMTRQLIERDERDRSREDAPMIAATDAVLIDTTDMSIDAAVDMARAVIDAAVAMKDTASSSFED